MALTDPVRKGVREAIAACRGGRHPDVILTAIIRQTAAAIARELGLGTRVVEASSWRTRTRSGGIDVAAGADVFARSRRRTSTRSCGRCRRPGTSSP